MIRVAKLRVSFHEGLPDEIFALLERHSIGRPWQRVDELWFYRVPVWVAELAQGIAAEHVGAVEA